jgi:hypothetical protein
VPAPCPARRFVRPGEPDSPVSGGSGIGRPGARPASAAAAARKSVSIFTSGSGAPPSFVAYGNRPGFQPRRLILTLARRRLGETWVTTR